MGLLDWLTDISSTVGLQSPEAAAMNASGTLPGQQQPPAQQPPQAQPPQAPPPQPPGPMTAQPPIQPGGGLPPGPTPAPPQASLPPNAAPTAGGPPMAMNDTPNTTFTPNTPAAPGMPTNPGQGRGFLGQAFGMNSADEKNTLGGLGAGLKSVGDNWNKPGLAAFAGSAGSAIQGGTATEDKRIDQMLKLVQAKQKAGDDSSATSLAAVRLQTAQLQLQNLKEGNGKGGKSWNKPPQQLYQDAMKLAENDPEVNASEKALEQTIKDGKPAEIAKAQADHKALIAAVRDKHLMGVGLTPQSAAEIAKQPGLTSENPVPQAAFNGKPFDQVIKPGADHDQYFVDEKGQTRVLKATKKSEAPKTTLDAQASIPQSPADAADEEE